MRRNVQETAQKKLGPIRNAAELKSLIEFLNKIKHDEIPSLAPRSKSRVYNKEWIDIIELANIVHLLEASAKSALFRTESRGMHYREDFPRRDDPDWLAWVMLKEEAGKMTVYKKPIPEKWWPDLSKPYEERYELRFPGE